MDRRTLAGSDRRPREPPVVSRIGPADFRVPPIEPIGAIAPGIPGPRVSPVEWEDPPEIPGPVIDPDPEIAQPPSREIIDGLRREIDALSNSDRNILLMFLDEDVRDRRGLRPNSLGIPPRHLMNLYCRTSPFYEEYIRHHFHEPEHGP